MGYLVQQFLKKYISIFIFKLDYNGKVVQMGIIGCGDVIEINCGPVYQKTANFSLQVVIRRIWSRQKTMLKVIMYQNTTMMRRL